MSHNYMTYNTNPSYGNSFNRDFISGLNNNQILAVFYEDRDWNVWLLPYSYSDWKPIKDCVSVWINWNKNYLGIDGTWDSFYSLSKPENQTTDLKRAVANKIFTGHTIDVRIKPRAYIPFGIITPSFPDDTVRLMEFLRKNIGQEHDGIVTWNELTDIEIKNKLCSRVTPEVDYCVKSLNDYNYPLILLTNHNKPDLIGGHCKLYEVVNAIRNLSRTPATGVEWRKVMDEAELMGFYRELSEELGLFRQPHLDYQQNWLAYIGKSTGESEPVWLYIDFTNVDIPRIIYMNMSYISQ